VVLPRGQSGGMRCETTDAMRSMAEKRGVQVLQCGSARFPITELHSPRGDEAEGNPERHELEVAWGVPALGRTLETPGRSGMSRRSKTPCPFQD